MRSATHVRRCVVMTSRFQSTHFMRSATKENRSLTQDELISIHALHAKCDGVGTGNMRKVGYFNPRTSCEVRQQHFKAHMWQGLRGPKVRIYSYITIFSHFSPPKSSKTLVKREVRIPQEIHVNFTFAPSIHNSFDYITSLLLFRL